MVSIIRVGGSQARGPVTIMVAMTRQMVFKRLFRD
jgi:hypothetical protein